MMFSSWACLEVHGNDLVLKGLDQIEVPSDINKDTESLTITKTGISSIRRNSFVSFSKLETLLIEENDALRTVQNGSFKGLVSLQRLFLRKNTRLVAIQYFHSDVFINLLRIDFEEEYLNSLPQDFLLNAKLLEVINLDDNNLVILPDISNLTKLETFRINNNQISVIPEEYFKGYNLLKVRLAKNHLTVIENLSHMNHSLIYLDIRGTTFTNFEIGALNNFTRLQTLNLNGAWAQFQIRELLYLTNGLPSLKTLSIEYNEIKYFPDEVLELFPSLETLYGGHNPIETFPNLFLNKELRNIYLQYTSIKNVTGKELKDLNKLEHLEMSSRLAQFPNLSHVNNLKTLILWYNYGIRNIPLGGLSPVPKLKKINLEYTSQNQFPCIACVRNSLTELYLGHNDISSINNDLINNDNLCQCQAKSESQSTNVGKFGLPYNDFDHLNKSTMLLFPRLWNFNAGNNRLTEFPYIGHIGNLWYLTLSGNSISEYPEYFLSMTFLRYVYISSNLLAEFPAFKNKIGIRELYLSYNRISYVSNEHFKNLYALEELGLEGNRIHSFEFSFRSPRLEWLNLQYNLLDKLNATFPSGDGVRVYVYLKGNPLDCSKDNMCWIKSENKTIRNAVIDVGDRPCVSPQIFVGKRWSDISKEEVCGGECNHYLL